MSVRGTEGSGEGGLIEGEMPPRKEITKGQSLELFDPKEIKVEVHRSYDGVTIDALTHQGGVDCKYDHNEDGATIGVTPAGLVYGAVIDGSGGSEKGLEAAQIMVERTSTILQIDDSSSQQGQKDRLEKIGLRLNRLVNSKLRNAKGKIEGYGCSVISLIDKKNKKITVGNVGDTRGFIIVERMVKDAVGTEKRVISVHNTVIDNWAADRADNGRGIGLSYLLASQEDKKNITQSIGTSVDEPDPEVNTIEYDAKEGDTVTVVLCSDGQQGDRISDFELLHWYQHTKDPRELQRRLSHMAVNRNGKETIRVRYGLEEDGFAEITNNKDSDNFTSVIIQAHF